MEFLSVDPLARKNSHLSPYAFADNSPIFKVDYLGGGGIIYLIVLPGAAGNVDPAIIVQQANDIANQLGINVLVKLFDHDKPENFNKDFMDATDNLVIIGENTAEVSSFFKKAGMRESASLDVFFGDNRRAIENAKRAGMEITDGPTFGASDRLQRLSVLSLAVVFDRYDHLSVMGLGNIHESGHNILKIGHNDGSFKDQGFMSPGLENGNRNTESLLNDPENEKLVEQWNQIMRNGKILKNPNLLGPYHSSDYLDSDSDCYRTPVDNYEVNRASAQEINPK